MAVQTLPKQLIGWLDDNGFQKLNTRATKQWPDQTGYWIELTVTGSNSNASLVLVRMTNAVAKGMRGRHVTDCGVALDMKIDIDVKEFEKAYQHFLNINNNSTAGSVNIIKYPLEDNNIAATRPAVVDKH